jgi:hypothetical protein
MPAVEPFIKRLGVTRLQTLLDPLGRIAKPGRQCADAVRPWGMPISYLIDRHGRLSDYITGEVEWQGRAFLDYYANG